MHGRSVLSLIFILCTFAPLTSSKSEGSCELLRALVEESGPSFKERMLSWVSPSTARRLRSDAEFRKKILDYLDTVERMDPYSAGYNKIAVKALLKGLVDFSATKPEVLPHLEALFERYHGYLDEVDRPTMALVVEAAMRGETLAPAPVRERPKPRPFDVSPDPLPKLHAEVLSPYFARTARAERSQVGHPKESILESTERRGDAHLRAALRDGPLEALVKGGRILGSSTDAFKAGEIFSTLRKGGHALTSPEHAKLADAYEKTVLALGIEPFDLSVVGGVERARLEELLRILKVDQNLLGQRNHGALSREEARARFLLAQGKLERPAEELERFLSGVEDLVIANAAPADFVKNPFLFENRWPSFEIFSGTQRRHRTAYKSPNQDVFITVEATGGDPQIEVIKILPVEANGKNQGIETATKHKSQLTCTACHTVNLRTGNLMTRLAAKGGGFVNFQEVRRWVAKEDLRNGHR